MATSVSDGEETLVVQAANLIATGDFASDASWTKGSGWTIGSGTGNASTATGSLSQAAGSPGLVDEDYYFLTYSVTSYTQGELTPYVAGTAGTAVSATGRYQEVIKAGVGSPGALLSFTPTGSPTLTASIDDVTLVEIGQSLYTTTTAGTYVLHLDLTNLTNGDEVMAMVGTKIRSTGSVRWMELGTWAHKQPMSNGKMSIPVASPHEIVFTLCQLAGSAVSVPWEVISL